MSEMNEKIIEKIKKCLELANNNPSAEEAKSAALMAQKLLAKYNISMSDIEDVAQEQIEESPVWFKDLVTWGVVRGWKYELAEIVASNFRCKHFFYGKQAAVFYGHKTDVQVAKEIYTFLFKNGDKLANKLVYKMIRDAKKAGIKSNTSGVYNSFVKGYLAGLRDALGQQCTALMVVIPEDVKDAYTERSKGFKSMNAGMRSNGFSDGAYSEGVKAGKSAMASRAIEG